jgi:hypothetical protein
MSYVVSSQKFFESLSTSGNSTDKLTQYFNQIPDAFFEALDKVDFSILATPVTIKRKHSESEVFAHQVYLFENFENIQDIIRKEDFLARAGYDTIELRINESYLETIETLNESLLGSIGDFLASLVSDPDPVEMGLNILRLVLDIIGLVPFTWVGFPVDIVANVLSALISLYKGEYFSMVLSLLSAIDITQASDALKMILKPAMPVLEPFMKFFFRSGKDVVALEKGVIALKDGIIRIGGKSLLDNVISLFKGLAGFFLNTAIGVVRMITSFMDTAINLVTFGMAGKFGFKISKLVDSIVVNISMIGKNFETATQILSKPGVGKEIAQSADDLAKAARKEVAQGAQDQALKAGKTSSEVGADIGAALKNFDATQADKYLNAKGYIGDLRNTVMADSKFTDSISHLSKTQKEVAVAAKVENELIGQAKLSVDKIMKDPEAVKILGATGWKPGGNHLIKIARGGNPQEVKKFFEVFLTNPAIAKNLSKSEIRAFAPFVAKPEAFIEGVAKFNGSVKTLEILTKKGGAIGMRAVPFKRVLNLVARLVWQKYGSLECIIQAGANKAGDIALSATSSLVRTGISALEESEESSNPRKAAAKVDCGLQAAVVQATTGSFVADFPGSTANLGGTANMGEDPAQAAEFQKKSTEYSKQVLASLGLDTSIDVQHALDYNEPVVQAYFADVYDPESGVINVNLVDKSRLDSTIQEMVRMGKIRPEEAAGIKAEALKLIQSGEEPEIKLPPVNEGLFSVKGLSFGNK